MVRGIGVDMVQISQMEAHLTRMSSGARARMFTPAELDAAAGKSRRAEYLATRFEVKEAAFKALVPLLDGESFDLRIVETRNRDDGSPYIQVDARL